MKTRNINRHFVSILLSLALVPGLMLGMSLTAHADPVNYPLWVGGKQVTDLNAANILANNTVSYDAASNTLTLNGAAITSGYTDEETDTIGIYYTGLNELSIVLKGSSRISGLDYGIFSENENADLTVSGDGSFNASIRGIAINSEGNLKIAGGTITATSTNDSIMASGLYGKTITITGGTLTASGTRLALWGKVKNSIAGTGWTNTTGTEGKEEIPAVTGEKTNDVSAYKKVRFPAVSAASVVKPPTARTLYFNGSALELVTAGTATGGTMQYALGTDATTAPTTGYTTSIPAKTDSGTYYVWYKVKGDNNHNDTKPACITVTIAEKKPEPPTTPSNPTPTKDRITISKKPTGVKVKINKNKVTVSWKKIKNSKKNTALLKKIKKIQVQYSTSKTFNKNVKSKKIAKSRKKITLKLKKKKTYYVQVRYVGKNGFSKWSKVKKAKTK